MVKRLASILPAVFTLEHVLYYSTTYSRRSMLTRLSISLPNVLLDRYSRIAPLSWSLIKSGYAYLAPTLSFLCATVGSSRHVTLERQS